MLALAWAGAGDGAGTGFSRAGEVPVIRALAAAMRDLAVRILPVYQEADANRYLNNLSALQLVAGSVDSAWNTRQSLLDRRRPQEAGKPIRPGRDL